MNNYAVVILNYNSSADTLSCVKMLRSLNVPVSSIIVVDNHSTDNSFDTIQSAAREDKFCLISALENKGYAAGNNIGIRIALKNKFEFICVLNPDVILKENVISVLIEKLSENPKIGLIGPTICYASNTNMVASSGGTFRFFSGKSSFNRNGEIYQDHGIEKCDYISGACMVFRGSYLKSVGYIPEEYFLNYEDNEWAFNFSKRGFEVACDTSTVVYHEGEGSIDKISGLQHYFLIRNRIIFQRRNANFIQKCVFYPKLVFSSVKSILVTRSFDTVRIYIDGFLNRNRYDHLQ